MKDLSENQGRDGAPPFVTKEMASLPVSLSGITAPLCGSCVVETESCPYGVAPMNVAMAPGITSIWRE